jgi:hypothetical protein
MTYFRQMMKNYQSQNKLVDNKENLLLAKQLDVLHQKQFQVITFCLFLNVSALIETLPGPA